MFGIISGIFGGIGYLIMIATFAIQEARYRKQRFAQGVRDKLDKITNRFQQLLVDFNKPIDFSKKFLALKGFINNLQTVIPMTGTITGTLNSILSQISNYSDVLSARNDIIKDRISRHFSQIVDWVNTRE